MTKTLWNIYPLYKFSNTNDLKNRVEAREVSRGKVRELIGLSSRVNKIGCLTYLSNYKESLIYVAAEI